MNELVEILNSSIFVSLSVNIILIVKAIIDLQRTAIDNRLQIREKDEEIQRLERMVEHQKKKVEKISKDYYLLKEKTI